jgi:predicted phosphodiesterase
MQVKEHRIKYSRPDKFKIYPIGDIHKGSIHCDETAIERQIDKIKNEPNSYWIGMGDYADSITKNDKRFEMGGLAPWVKSSDIIESQRKELVRLFTPIKSKCLGLLTGNHEEALHKANQDDITRHICDDLGVTYLGYSCFLVLIFERMTEHWQLVIHAWHGSGAAQTEGARLNRLMRLVNEIEADIYLMGHLHAMTQHIPDRLSCRNGRVKSQKLAATITGSWLRAYTQPINDDDESISYAEQKGYKPSRIGCPVINIHPNSREFTIEG